MSSPREDIYARFRGPANHNKNNRCFRNVCLTRMGWRGACGSLILSRRPLLRLIFPHGAINSHALTSFPATFLAARGPNKITLLISSLPHFCTPFLNATLKSDEKMPEKLDFFKFILLFVYLIKYFYNHKYTCLIS